MCQLYIYLRDGAVKSWKSRWLFGAWISSLQFGGDDGYLGSTLYQSCDSTPSGEGSVCNLCGCALRQGNKEYIPWLGITNRAAQKAGQLYLKVLVERGFTLGIVAETPYTP
jgi:hypothetical protein